MIEQTLIQEIHTLPESLKQEVLHFVRFLKHKQYVENKLTNSHKVYEAKSTKIMFEMTSDFNELLEEFAEFKSRNASELIR